MIWVTYGKTVRERLYLKVCFFSTGNFLFFPSFLKFTVVPHFLQGN